MKKKEVKKLNKIDAQAVHKKRALITEKIRESFVSTLPIIIIVAIMCLSIQPVPTGLLLSFLIGALLIIVGMGLFTLGADTSMTPIGSRIGTTLTKSKNLPLILFVSFILGVAITIAEPDLQVLAETVPHIDGKVLLITVGVGVGLFLAVCMLRTILGIRLKWLILAFYIIVFVLAAFADKNFLSIAFDSGGVTTGPMTVPFILALGIGVANIRSDKKAEADSFGLVALCSIGPVLAVLILGFFYKGQGVADVNLPFIPETTTEMGLEYLKAFPAYMKEMAIALSPIIVLFLIFQVAAFKMSKKSFLKTLIGILYTYVGLVLFLTGVNVGFSPLGLYLGQQLYSGWTQYILIPVAMLMGWFIISAEPAVFVLEKQIEDVSSGAIPGLGRGCVGTDDCDVHAAIFHRRMFGARRQYIKRRFRCGRTRCDDAAYFHSDHRSCLQEEETTRGTRSRSRLRRRRYYRTVGELICTL